MEGNGGEAVNKTSTVRTRRESKLKGRVVIPTRATAQTFESTNAGRDLVICKDADDMFAKLRI
jgi:hypothetical protein